MAQIIEISNLQTPELDIYTLCNEAQLLHYYEPNGGLFLAESPKVITRALDAGYEPISMLLETGQLQGEAADLISRCPDIPIYTADLAVLKEITGYSLTRGALCAMKRAELPSVSSVCQNAHRIAVLENVVNPTNIGAIFRSAAAMGMDAVLLTPSCSDPLYRRAIRVSMGCVFQIPWTYLPAEDPAIADLSCLKDMGFATVSLALCDRTIDIRDSRLVREEKLAILLGSEGDGLNPATISASDYVAKIPMTHQVDSLNVAAASAVAFWELAQRKS